MSFLAPLFLFGALAVALPIVFHLIRRSSRERVPFSSLMFLAPTPPKVTRRSRLEHWFLLALRCLVLLILAAGFARPFFKRPTPVAPTVQEGKQIIVLIDTSASMRRQNLFAAAQAKAREVLARASLGDQVAVLAFDRQVRPVVSFNQWNALEPGQRAPFAEQAIAALQPTWAATHLGSALTRAAELFDEREKSDKAFEFRQIVLISDVQEGSRLDGLQGYEWPRGIEVAIEPIKGKNTTNGGLQILADSEESEVAVATESGPRVRVSNSGESKREQFVVHWEGVSGVPPLELYVPPGQSRIAAAPSPRTTNALANAQGSRTNAPSAAPAPERLLLTGDDEDFDNRVFFVPPKPRQVQVIYFGNENPTDPAEPLYYLRRAFQQTRRQTVHIQSFRTDARVPAEAESGSLIVISESLPEAHLKTVERLIREGRVALLVVKKIDAIQTLAGLTGLGSVVSEEIATSRYAMLGEINFEHPLFSPFADPRFSDFTKIHFWKHRRVDTASIAGARVLARFDNGNPALIEVPVGKGILLALTSGWHPADSQFALSSKFVPLLYSILEQSAGPKAQRAQYWVGDSVTLPKDTGAPFSVHGPDGTKHDLPVGETFSKTDLPGIYAVQSAVAEYSFRFAVNIDAAESKTAPIPLETFERLGVPLQKVSPERPKQTEAQRQHLLATELERQQQLWRWLVIAALGMLVFETAVAGWVTRRTQSFQAGSSSI